MSLTLLAARTRRTAAVALATFATGAALVVAAGTAESAEPPAPNGLTAATAAASCWEIKQNQSDAADGAYWLYTPRLSEPQRFYCDMTTNGGGWVLVGRGRERWEGWYHGQGSADTLATGPTTPTTMIQLGSRTIDGLLNGTHVSALPDGIRIQRVTSRTDPSKVQDVYFSQNARNTGWMWSLRSISPVSSWRVEQPGQSTVSGTGGTTTSFGSGTGRARVVVDVPASQNYTTGFAYGTSTSGPLGDTADGSYIYSAASNGTSGRPFASVYIRPRLTSSATNTRIDDSGTPKVERAAVADYRAAYSVWGVAGKGAQYTGEGHVAVQTFAQQGSTMYVGGNFATVQKGKDAVGADLIAQPFVAAFDQKTGAFLPGFRPTLNGEVRGMAALPGNRVAIVGAFTSVNGAAATGVAVLNADGTRDPAFSLKLENRVSGSQLKLRAVAYAGGRLYIGGGFSHVTGGTPVRTVYARNAVRVDATTGRPDVWNPEFNGSVESLDVSTDNARVYLAGFFTNALGGSVPARRAAAVNTTATATMAEPAWAPVWSHEYDYQQAIAQSGDDVWVAGSEHSMFSFSTSTFNRLSTSVTDRFNGGDGQTIAVGPGVVYAGCHCSDSVYDGATVWRPTTFTNAEKINYIGAWDATTRRVIPEFNPVIQVTEGAGAWGSFVDTDNTLWVGGDLWATRYTQNSKQWSGGFARFPEQDHTAPSTPTVSSVVDNGTDVTLSWSAASDAAWPITYHVLRDDRVIAVTRSRTLTVPKGGENRFFLRAVDPNGNLGASTSVIELTAPAAARMGVAQTQEKPAAPSPSPSPTPSPSPSPSPTQTTAPVPNGAQPVVP